MRIGISGAQSTGKTTLLNALRSESFFKGYAVCNEVTRKVASYGIPINENGTDVTQTLIMNQHIVNIMLNDNMITDRTSLDGLVYTLYLAEKGSVSNKTVDYAKQVFCRTYFEYDILFYIAPEFDIKHDGVRSTDDRFRDEIVTLFDNVILDYDVNVVRLSGSVRERVEQALKAIEEKFNG